VVSAIQPVGGGRFDAIVAGAGLVGLATATALARSGLAVAIVDRARPGAATAPIDEWDRRVYAISPGSARFLSTLGAWQELACERIAAVESMWIAGDAGATLEFSAYDAGERALAWIVEERALRGALRAVAYAAGVTLHEGAACEHLAWSSDETVLTLGDGSGIAARLVVGADGLESWVRAAAGLDAKRRAWQQLGVVANFATELPHRGCARQWFRDDGSVLAWLPLPGSRISIVWSAPEALAHELTGLAPPDLATRVGEAGGDALGALTPLGTAAAFPLHSLRVASPVARRLALVGDAAHGVHPLAGQGVNLGFGDAETLAGVLAGRGPVADCGAALLLERYARTRAEPVLAMQTAIEALGRLFALRSRAVRTIRNAGMSAIDRMPLLKNALARAAMHSV
jgi:ubiquinone biosynthesis UbiH/UbiF/VisC/COQ6 family hydroxylase